MALAKPDADNKNSKNLALEFILLFGLVSALGDITYETGRGISGPYLAFLGAGAATIGLVSGFGEFLGYALRLVSGYLASRTHTYWIATYIGYGLLLSIPLLAFTNRWEIAVVLLILERIGKAIRSPAKDTMLSHASYQIGRGWGFAVHEALDQIGAVIGPLIFTVAFLQRNSYRDGFNILWIPAALTLVALVIARIRVPAPEELENTTIPQDLKKCASQFETTARFLDVRIVHLLMRGRFRQFPDHLLPLGVSIGGSGRANLDLVCGRDGSRCSRGSGRREGL